jgi:hypothetical protein
MWDWIASQIYEVLKILITGFVSFVLGMWYFNKYILPKIYVKMGSNLFKGASEDPNFKPWIERFKKIVEEIEPLVAKFKKVDFEKTLKDLQPFLDSVKKIDPQTVDDLLKSVKELAKTATKAIEKPKSIPQPNKKS